MLVACAAAGMIATMTTATGHGDVINTTNDGYSVEFTPDDGMNPLTAGEFPQLQAQRLADALSNTSAPATGNPNGYHNGYDALGFDAPDFDGTDRDVQVFDCAGGCDSGSAPADRINMPADMYRTKAEDCLRLVIGHELFHHVQYEAIGFDNWSTWGGDPVEGTARVMQDKVYSDLDADAGCITYLSQVNDYLGSPDVTLWGRSYTTALFWNYLMEQLGNDRAEPGVGTDVIRRFWQNAQDAGDNRDFLATLRETIHDYDSGLSLEEMFHRFSIANYTKLLDVSALPDGLRYRYVDEQQAGATAYDDVPVIDEGNLPPAVGPKSVSVDRYAAKYVQADIGDCTGVAGVVVDGDRAGLALVSQASGEVKRLDKATTTHFARAMLIRKDDKDPKRVTRLGLVVTGLGDAATVDYTFACGQYGLDIRDPLTAQPAFVGPKSNAQRFIVRLRVQGPPELGTPSVEGLRAEDFTVKVGSDDATVLNGLYVGGEYWLTVQAPDLPGAAADLQDLTVTLGTVADSENDAVSYQVKRLDQMITVDRSGSMLDPAVAPKIDAARNAGSLYVDVARGNDKLGVVSFSGDNSEPNDDATLDALLLQMNAGNRATARAKVLGLTAGGMTSIGDGLAKSAAEYPIRGTAIGEDWIVLLSDGMENEGKFYNDVRSQLTAAGIRVDTIALGPLSDQELLQRIANETGGRYYYVDVTGGSTAKAAGFGGSSLANQLANYYFTSNEDAGDLQRFWDASGSLPSGAVTTRVIDLGEDKFENAVIAVNWPATPDAPKVTLTDPNGNVVTAWPGVVVSQTDTHAVYQLDTMDRGTWTIDIDNNGPTRPFVAMAAGEQHLGATMWIGLGATAANPRTKQPEGFRWGVPVPVIADLTDRKGTVLGADVTAEVTHPDGDVTRLPLLDDGDHGDGLPDDGVYANTYTRTTEFARKGADDTSPKPNGSYAVRVTATGRSNLGDDFTRIGQTSFAVYENGDPNPDKDGDGMADLYEALHPCLDATDPGDLGLDQDDDGLRTKDEWNLGTDPCHPDTDRGGEPDRSEVTRGANPFDPRDDALPRPEDPSVVSKPIDHLGQPPLKSKALLIRYPANQAYDLIRLWRATAPGGPFTRIVDFDSTAHGGLYLDKGLVNGQKYWYRIQGIDFAGHPSTMSPVFSGTAKKQPFAPIGHVLIAGDRPYVDTTTVKLSLGGDTRPITSMMIADNSRFAGAVWEPFSATRTWTLAPDANGFATVYAKFRNGAGNVSNVVSDEVWVRAALTSVQGQLVPDVAPTDGSLAGVYIAVVGRRDIPLVRTNAAGAFTVSGLPPGSYSVRALGGGYRTAGAVAMGAGVTNVPVVCDGTC